MKTSVGLLAIVLIVMTANEFCLAASLAELEGAQSYHFKRSLCNTFGGCGAKRSLQQPPSYVGVLNANDGPNDKDSLPHENKRDQNPYLASEMLGDLIDHPDTYGRHKQPKYVVLVPRQYDSSALNAAAINQAQVEPADIQELRLGRIYLNRNE